MKRAVLYFRTSKSAVDNRTNSLAVQREQLTNYCTENGIVILGEYSDFTEGKQINYEGLNNALHLFFNSAYSKNPIDYFLIVSADIIGEMEADLIRAELGFYSSELKTIQSL